MSADRDTSLPVEFDNFDAINFDLRVWKGAQPFPFP
jgi:hypothetical protein